MKKFRYVLTALLIAMPAASVAQPSTVVGIGVVRAYRTPAGAELIDTLPLRRPDSALVVFSTRVDRLREGDLLMAFADMEVTNDCGYNIAIGTYITATTDSSSVERGPGIMAHANGFNVTPNMHHGVSTRTGALVITPELAGERWINLVAYAQSSDVSCSGLRVERGYGQLVILHYTR